MTANTRGSKTQAAQPPGVIEGGTIYTIAEVRSRLRLGDWAWRKLRRSGLPIHKFGKQSFVIGDELIEHFRQM